MASRNCSSESPESVLSVVFVLSISTIALPPSAPRLLLPTSRCVSVLFVFSASANVYTAPSSTTVSIRISPSLFGACVTTIACPLYVTIAPTSNEAPLTFEALT